jgi:hypothetical protein
MEYIQEWRCMPAYPPHGRFFGGDEFSDEIAALSCRKLAIYFSTYCLYDILIIFIYLKLLCNIIY